MIKYKKTLYSCGVVLFIISVFLNAYLLKNPKIITKEAEKKVYDFSQEPHMVEIYANTMGKTLRDVKIYEQEKSQIETQKNSLLEEIKQLEIKKSDLIKDFNNEKTDLRRDFELEKSRITIETLKSQLEKISPKGRK